LEGFLPRRRSQSSVLADHGSHEPLGVFGEIESVSALDTEKVVIDSALVAIIAADNFHAGVGAAHAQSCFAPVSTVRAGGPDVVHLPGASLVAIGSRGKRANRADIDTHAAFFALEVIFFVWCDDRAHATVLHAESPHVHGLAAHTHAAVTEDAARAVKVNYRRPL